jgi:hypothetical protein
MRHQPSLIHTEHRLPRQDRGHRTGNGPYRENPRSKLVEVITPDQAAWAFFP